MAASTFSDNTSPPTHKDLLRTLGQSGSLLRDIENHLSEVIGKADFEWKYYGRKAGWTLAYLQAKRRLFHLIPGEGSFELVFVLGPRALEAARTSDLPAETKAAIEGAQTHAEGTSVRITIATVTDLEVVEQLLAIKMAN
jgi:hypothetical protein